MTHLHFYHHWFITKLICERLLCLGEKFTAFFVKNCPCCNRHTESIGYFHAYPNNSEKWGDLQDFLTDIFTKHKVDPILRLLLIAYICKPTTSLLDLTTKHPTIDFRAYYAFIKAQAKIGWIELQY
eukprot:4667699-Ditylum_brightwellii.AAC.1